MKWLSERSFNLIDVMGFTLATLIQPVYGWIAWGLVLVLTLIFSLWAEKKYGAY